MGIVDRLAVARGEHPADLVLRNAKLVNVVSGEIYETDIVIAEGIIVGLGSGYSADAEIDLGGKYVAPGLIDAHVHIESSLCTPPEFAKAVLPHGVTTVLADPHEIANVMGIPGMQFMLDQSADLPLNVMIMASSCVPATHMETSGAVLEAEDLQQFVGHERVPGLAEVMNYPGVVYGDEGMLDKLAAYDGYVIDGHCPALTGKELNAYVTAGIHSEHECTTPAEALEKLRLGMTILIREGTTTRNLKPLLPMVTAENHGYLCFCTDDRMPASLLDEGTIDFMVRTAIHSGIDPIHAIRMGSLNTARYFRLYDRGMIAPGKCADLIVVDDLENFTVEMTFVTGRLVAKNGEMVETIAIPKQSVPQTVNVGEAQLDFSIAADGGTLRVIETVGDQVVSGHLQLQAKIENGQAVVDTARDILKMVVIERHQASGNIGKGFIHGFGLKKGAIAGTVAHDHHNLVVIGADDVSMRHAAQAVIDLGGGIAVVDGGAVLATLALPIAGLMSDAPIDAVRRDYDACIAAARELGSGLPDPMMSMSFMALEVIPKLKLTDVGLVDVEQFKVVDLFV